MSDKPDGNAPDANAAAPVNAATHHSTLPTIDQVGGTLRVASGMTEHEGIGDASALYGTFVQGRTAVQDAGAAFQDLKDGKMEDGLATTLAAGVNLASAAVNGAGLASKYIPKVADLTKDMDLSSLGMKLGYAADLVTVGKSFVEGGPTTEAKVENAAATLGHIAVTRGLVAAGGITATAYLQLGDNAVDNYNIQKATQQKLAAIKPDTKNQADLRQVIGQLAATSHPELKNLKHDAKGQVDLVNADNQKAIKAALQAEDKTLSAKIGANEDQFVIPAPVVGNIHVHALDNLHGTQTGLMADGGRDPKAAQVAADAQVQQKRVEVALGELESAGDASKFTQIKGRTAAQEHDDVVLARRQAGGGPQEEVVTVQASRFGKLTTDNTKAPLPQEVVDAYKADPKHNLQTDVPLYEKGANGKPVLDAKGNPVVGKIVHYNVMVEGGQAARPSGSQWDMTAAEQQGTFGSTWQAERRFEAQDKVATLKNNFDKSRQALGKSNTDATRQAAIDAYTAYERGLTSNAKDLGLNAKQLAATINQAGKDFQNAFVTPNASVKSPVTVATNVPPRRPSGPSA